jgi:hypothetical protein
VLVRVPPLSVIVAVEPQLLLLELTWKLVGAVAVTFASRFKPVMLKLVDAPAVPAVVAGTVTVPPAVDIVGVTTLKVDEVAAGAVLPALSLAVPAGIEMPKVPAPVMLEIVTVYEVPEPDNPTVPLAVLVLLSVIFPSTKVLVLKFASL